VLVKKSGSSTLQATYADLSTWVNIHKWDSTMKNRLPEEATYASFSEPGNINVPWNGFAEVECRGIIGV
jgi:hypothetical protein